MSCPACVGPSFYRPGMEQLTDEEKAILDFEGGPWWRYAGAKESAVRDRFGISATRYYQRLNTLIDQPAAQAHAPLLVKRLRRLRSQRQRQRSARRLDGAR